MRPDCAAKLSVRFSSSLIGLTAIVGKTEKGGWKSSLRYVLCVHLYDDCDRQRGPRAKAQDEAPGLEEPGLASPALEKEPENPD